MLHLLNGDATLAVFPATLPGHRAVWREIMVEGPALDDGAARAAWLARRLGVIPDEYERGWREGLAALARAGADDEVILWFEQDLFCAVNLWFVITRLPATTPVWLVFPPLSDMFAGLGSLASSEFAGLFERRRRLDGDARADAEALWRAYAASDPSALARSPAALAFADEAVRLHLGRFPSTAQGVDEIEAATLHALVSGPRAFADLFRAVTHAPPHRRHGMGDVQYAAALRDLQPLIAIDGAAAPFTGWRVALTSEGLAVLEGRLDGLAPRALDRWLGGVHLRRGAPDWRWDGHRLVRR
jgi:hypothetical protein